MSNSFHVAGKKAFDENNYEEAMALFAQSIEKYPEETESHFYLAKCYFYRDEKQQALASVNKFIELSKDNSVEVSNVAYAYDLLGQCHEAENHDTEALACYKKATEIYPSCAAAWNNMGLLRLKSAKSYLETDIKVSMNLFKEAQFFILKALKISSSYPIFLQSLANWYEQYTTVLEIIAENETEAINAYFNTAMDCYQKALSACREDDLAQRNIIFVNLTECKAQYGHYFYRNEAYEKAREIYLEALERDPEHISVLTQIGMSYSKQDCFPEAREYFLPILKIAKEKQDLSDAWLNIAHTYRLEKNLEEAEKALEQAEKLTPEDSYVVKERKELEHAKSVASLLAAPQSLLASRANLNPAPFYEENIKLSYQS